MVRQRTGEANGEPACRHEAGVGRAKDEETAATRGSCRLKLRADQARLTESPFSTSLGVGKATWTAGGGWATDGWAICLSTRGASVRDAEVQANERGGSGSAGPRLVRWGTGALEAVPGGTGERRLTGSVEVLSLAEPFGVVVMGNR